MSDIEIHAIIHPFFLQQRIPQNLVYYESIISKSIANPQSRLLYMATEPDLEKTSFVREGYERDRDDFGKHEDYMLQQRLLKLSYHNRNIALLKDDSRDSEYSWRIGFYRPREMSHYLELDARTKENDPMKYFLGHGINPIYSHDLTRVYLDITDMTSEQRIQLWNEEKTTENGRTYLTGNLNFQLAKLIRGFGTEEAQIGIGGQSALTIPSQTRQKMKIIGHGEFLEACVFGECSGLTLTLGAPLEKMSLDTEQPYLNFQSEYKRELSYLEKFQHPLEYIFGNIPQLYEGGYNGPFR